MLEYQMYLFFPVLVFPLFIILLFYPSAFIRKASKILAILSVIYVFSALPIIILIELNYWILLLIIIPLIFTAFEIIAKKLNISGYIDSINKDIINRIFLSSIGGIIAILCSSELSKWIPKDTVSWISYGAWSALLIFVVISTNILEKVKDKQLGYGAIFGIVSIIVGPALRNEIGVATYVCSWLIYIIPSTCIPYLKKAKYTEAIIFTLVPATTFVLLGQGGIPFSWDYRYYSILTLLLTHFVIFTLNYIVEKQDILPVIKQYFIPIFLSILIIVFNFFSNSYVEFNSVFPIVIAVLSVETLIISYGRFIMPLRYKNELYIKRLSDQEIRRIFILFFKDSVGNFIFNTIFGTNYKKIRKKDIFIGSILIMSIPILMGILIGKGFSTSNVFDTISIFKSSFLLLIVLFMMKSSVVIMNDISDLLSKGKIKKGLREDEAIKKGSSISVNYLFLVVYYLMLNLPLVSKINKLIIFIVVVWIMVVSLSLNVALAHDLKIKNYNSLKKVRHLVSVILFGITYFILVYLSSTNSIDITSDNSFYKTFHSSYYFVGISIILCKLVGFDTAIASNKLRKKFIIDSIIFPFAIIGLSVLFGISEAYITFTKGDMNKFLHIKSFITMLSFLCFSRTIILAVIPSTNDLNETIFDYLLFKGISEE